MGDNTIRLKGLSKITQGITGLTALRAYSPRFSTWVGTFAMRRIQEVADALEVCDTLSPNEQYRSATLYGMFLGIRYAYGLVDGADDGETRAIFDKATSGSPPPTAIDSRGVHQVVADPQWAEFQKMLDGLDLSLDGDK